MYNCYIYSVKSGELEEGGMKGERKRERGKHTRGSSQIYLKIKFNKIKNLNIIEFLKSHSFLHLNI